MADIGKYKAHQKMMQDPERRKAYIEAMKRRKKDTASQYKISKPSRSMMVDTTTSAYGDKGRGRPVPKFIDPVIPKNQNQEKVTEDYLLKKITTVNFQKAEKFVEVQELQ